MINEWESDGGRFAEKRFCVDLFKQYGNKVSIYESNKEEDIHNHIDRIVCYWDKNHNRKRYTFDIKGPRKATRHDIVYDTNNILLEIRSVRGESGSVFGKEDYIAFVIPMDELAEKYTWQIYKRIDLEKFLLDKFGDDAKYNADNLKTYESETNQNRIPYRLYARKNRKDIFTYIPITDIEKIKHIELGPKELNRNEYQKT